MKIGITRSFNNANNSRPIKSYCFWIKFYKTRITFRGFINSTTLAFNDANSVKNLCCVGTWVNASVWVIIQGGWFFQLWWLAERGRFFLRGINFELVFSKGWRGEGEWKGWNLFLSRVFFSSFDNYFSLVAWFLKIGIRAIEVIIYSTVEYFSSSFWKECQVQMQKWIFA